MQRQKIFNLPGAVLAVIAALGLIHGMREYVLSDEQDAYLLQYLAFVPGRFTVWFDAAGVADALPGVAGAGAGEAEAAARFYLGDGRPQWWTFLTYSVLHADWVHFSVNSLWLAAFGTPVARRFGASRFLALLAVTAIAGALLHWAAHRFDLNPVIGASAAVSGAMAAAVRFIFQPNAPLGDGFGFGAGEPAAYRQPALPIRQVLANRRTLPFILLWFAANFVFGIASAPLGITDAPIAWEAHAGGFLAGLLLFALFDPAGRVDKGEPPR